MYFDNEKLNAEGLDFSTKEAREKSKARIMELLNNGKPNEKRAAKILGALFGVIDDMPDSFALVHEMTSECDAMAKKLHGRLEQLEAVARRIGEHGQPVHRFGQVDAYLAVAYGALSTSADILRKLEKYVAQQAAEKEEKGDAPSGSETPTEPPPAELQPS